MKINWKVRLKNPVFWMTIIPALISFVYSMLGAFGIVPRITSSELESGVGMLISALTTLGVLVDPTTNGLGDSRRAMSYTCPKDSDSQPTNRTEDKNGL